ncbi:O-antigen polymerase [Vibrio rumoiensis]|uniref:O-antigen polymerase n=1 Tax=Vibrio rumoiensis TaxID=76258 RepID=UPI003AA7F34E
MSPFFLAALYDTIFYLPSSTLAIYPDLNGIYTIFLVSQVFLYLIFSVCFVYVYNQNISYKRNLPLPLNNNVKKGMGIFLYIIIVTVCIFLFLYLFYSVFAGFDFSQLITNNSKFYAESKVGTAWVFFVYQFLIYLMLYDVYRSGFKSYKFYMIFFSIFLIALTGGRSTIISYLVLMSFIYFVVYEKAVRMSLVISFVCLFFAVLSGNALLRHGQDTSFVDYINSDAFKLDFNSSFVLQDSIDYVHNNDDYYLISLEDAYYSFIPRNLMPSKPVSTAETRLVYKDMLSDGRTTNITFGVYGNMIINFGYVGLFIGFLCFFIANYQYIRVCSRLSYRRACDFIFLFFFMMFILVLRGGFFNMRVVLSLIVVSFAVLFYESFRKLRFF